MTAGSFVRSTQQLVGFDAKQAAVVRLKEPAELSKFKPYHEVWFG